MDVFAPSDEGGSEADFVVQESLEKVGSREVGLPILFSNSLRNRNSLLGVRCESHGKVGLVDVTSSST